MKRSTVLTRFVATLVMAVTLASLAIPSASVVAPAVGFQPARASAVEAGHCQIYLGQFYVSPCPENEAIHIGGASVWHEGFTVALRQYWTGATIDWGRTISATANCSASTTSVTWGLWRTNGVSRSEAHDTSIPLPTGESVTLTIRESVVDVFGAFFLQVGAQCHGGELERNDPSYPVQGWTFIRLDGIAGLPHPPTNNSPSASCTATQSGPAGRYHFVATASDPDGDALSYSWSFGDGSPAAPGDNATHDFAKPGTFASTVTVTDGKGGSAIAACSVNVPAPQLGLAISLPDKPDGNVDLDETFTARLTVSVDGNGVGDLTNLHFVGDALRLSPDGHLEITDGPTPAIPDSFSMSPGDDPLTFDYAVHVLSHGTATFTSRVAGKDAANRDVDTTDVTHNIAAPSLKVTITPSKNDFKLEADNDGAPKAEDIVVTIKVQNATTEQINNVVIGPLDLAAADPLRTYDPFPAAVVAPNVDISLGSLAPGEIREVTRTVKVTADGRMKLLTLATSEAGNTQGEGKLNTDVQTMLKMTIDGNPLRMVNAGSQVSFFGHFTNVTNERTVAVTDPMKTRFQGNLLGSGIIFKSPSDDGFPAPVIGKLGPGETLDFEVHFNTSIPTFADYDAGTWNTTTWTSGQVDFNVWIRAAAEDDDGSWQAISAIDACICKYPESVLIEGGNDGAFDIQIDTTERVGTGGDSGTIVLGLGIGALEGAQSRLSGLWNFAALAFGVTLEGVLLNYGFEYRPAYVDEALSKELIKGRLKDTLDYLAEVAVWLPQADAEQVKDAVGAKMGDAYSAFTETVTGGIPRPEENPTVEQISDMAGEYLSHLQGAWHRADPNQLLEAMHPIGGFIGETATDVLVGEVALEGLMHFMRTERVVEAATAAVEQVDDLAEMQQRLPSLTQSSITLGAADRSKSNYELLEFAFQTRTELNLTDLGGTAGFSAETIEAAETWTAANPGGMIVIKPNEPRAAALRDAGLAVGKGELIKPKSLATIEYLVFGGRSADDINFVVLRDLSSWTPQMVEAKVAQLVAAGEATADDLAVAMQILSKRNKEWKYFTDRGIKDPVTGAVTPDPSGIGRLKAYDEAGKIPNQFQGTSNNINFSGPEATLDFQLDYYKGTELLPPSRASEADYVFLRQEHPKTGNLVGIVGDDDGIFIGYTNGMSIRGAALENAMKSIYEAFEHPFSDSWLTVTGAQQKAKLEVFTPHMEVIPGTTEAGKPAVAFVNGKAYSVKLDGNLSRFDPATNEAYLKWVGIPQTTTRAAPAATWIEVTTPSVPNLRWPASFLRGLFGIPNAATNPNLPPINGQRNARVIRLDLQGNVESWTPQTGWRPDPVAQAEFLAGNINVAPQTQTYGSIEPGAVRVEISSQTDVGMVGQWFEVGDLVVLDPGGPNEETAKISGFGSLIFAEPLKHAHEAGEIITFLSGPDVAPPPTTTPPPPTTTPPPTTAPTDSAYGLKQSALAALQAIPANTKAKINKRLAAAAERITASLALWRWNGYDALNPAYGRVVFNTERKAIQILAGKLFRSNPTVTSVIQTLLAADKRLVQLATAANTNARDVATANKRLARADSLIAQGKYAKALNALKAAWLAAVR